MVRIEFETDNAAFENDLKHWEIVRILKAICQQIEELRDPCIITDRNGNTIGTIEIT